MTIKKIQDAGLINAVKQEIESNPNREYLNYILNSVLAGKKCYLWGGAVRDPILKALQGINGSVEDFDILVDDSEERIVLREVLKKERNFFYNRCGTIKLKPKKDFEIDISKFSHTNKLRNGENLPVSLETCLNLCDFTTSAIAYDLNNQVIYDNGALEGIDMQVVELMRDAQDEPHIMMARLVLHSDKFGFKIGPRGIALIKNAYSSELNESIANYLKYRGMPEKQEKVIARLNKIAGS